MDKEEKIINYLRKKFRKNISMNSKILIDLDLDSFKFVQIVSEIEKKLKKKYTPIIIEDLSKFTIKKFSKLFR
mgnify:CR=1 FL=1